MTDYLPDGEVQSHDVLEWAMGQAQYLSPTQAHVLLYLCINAWHTPTNPENAPVGQILSGRTSLRKIQMKTGLSERTVRDALNALQDAGYVCREFKPGNGKSAVAVFWTAEADEMRAEVRAGARDLPVGFQRVVKTSNRHLTAVTEANILEFRTGSSRRNDRQ